MKIDPMKAFLMPCVYLDLNHYINMAKAVKNGDTSLFDRLKALVDAKRAVIPVSAALIMEIQGIKDPQQRADIGNIIKPICNGFIIRDYFSVLQMEVTNKVAQHYGDTRQFSLPIRAFGFGYMEAFGHLKIEFPEGAKEEYPELNKMEAETLEYLASDKAFDEVLNQLFVAKLAEGGPEHQAFIKATAEARDASKSVAFQKFRAAYSLNLLDIVQREFDAAAIDLGLLVNGLHPPMPNEFRTGDFINSIPTLSMWSDLHLNLYHRNLQSRAEINDMYDMAHLAVAVPYCDVVVCDKKMEAILKQSELPKKYETVMFSNLEKAICYLEGLA